MKLIKRHGILNSRARIRLPHTVVLHHTAGGNLSGAVSTLKMRGLGYHYLIDKDGTVYEYVPASRYASHAYRRNTGTVGVSYVGGRTPQEPMNDDQMSAVEDLLTYLKNTYPSLKKLTGHKHIDPRTKSSRWPAKPDPYWPGDTVDGYKTGKNWINDEKYMNDMSLKSGLTFVSELFPKNLKGKY